MSAGELEYASSCVIPTSWTPLPLKAKEVVNGGTFPSVLFTFGLPPGATALCLPVCSCLLLQDDKGNVRPYTPTSAPDAEGIFQLLIKIYPTGVVSSYLNSLAIGTSVDFKHIKFNIKEQYPFPNKKKILMISGGTGITPMYQALRQIVETPGDDHEVVLLYGNQKPDDILLRNELDAMVAKANGRLKVVHVVGVKQDQEPIDGWDGELGWVDKEKVAKFGFPPADDVFVFVCGVPPLYNTMCGPRNEPELKEGTVLHQLGYTTGMVSKF